jgi:HPt (histidine-containing phosphotransfer) domain-containing protein
MDAILANRRPAGPFPDAALKERFLDHRAREVIEAREALARGDFDALETIGHKLQGNGTSYGFPGLSILGRSIEDAAKTRDAGMLAGLLAQLATAVSKATVVAA